MTQEEKDLLLKDLCGRLSYGVMLKHISIEKPFKLFSIKRDEYASYIKEGVDLAANGIYYDWYVNDIYHDIELYIKPYLFPLSSMTGEQFEELKDFAGLKYEGNTLELVEWDSTCDKTLEFWLEEIPSYCVIKVFDWLNKNHFDYRGLIPMGLAIDATGKNIYKYE